ncbi:thioesterase II family protein [Actinophytocola oryzae]|uniref:Medium-chain acyl-[acyl-carrier-protein] hydrolase n=1 Tax=Actinophytocola oryzae TaxID=502181 RepID=A0A4R7UWX4_9PSEU|nr:alpha/beta fold hydrolase [Actinophytocola oryzae]TDV41020.1 medium-chain acyl-[acyl-carrier-protein] hydrolase [Actinophytocola oryzae]
MTAQTVGRWFVQGVARPDRRRLFCFPHGGGSAAEFVRWARHLPEVEVRAVQLPGRGTRLSEPVLDRMDDLVEAVTAVIPTTAPYSVFGHSLGALVGYEVTAALHRAGRRLPDNLVVSGFPAPSTTRTEPPLHTLPDEELIDEVGRRHGGLPEELLADAELRRLVARYLRADYAILETYEWRGRDPLPVPLTVFGGRDDSITTDALQAWQRHTTEEITLRLFAGGHFYFRRQQTGVLRALAGAATRTRRDAVA